MFDPTSKRNAVPDAKSLLDSLMGVSRNQDLKEQKKNKGNNFKADSICKHYLLGFCPTQELAKANRSWVKGGILSSECKLTHSDAMKLEFEAHPDFEKLQTEYDRSLLATLEKFVRDADTLASKEKDNIKKNEVDTPVSTQMKKPQWTEEVRKDDQSGGSGDGDADPLVIKHNEVSMLLGMGGENIQRIQRDSGAELKFVKEEGRKPSGRLTFHGPPDAAAKAREMVLNEVLSKDRRSEIEIARLTKDMTQLMTTAEELAQMGDVERSKLKIAFAEEIKNKIDKLNAERVGPKWEVCDVCGQRLLANDPNNPARYEEHFSGVAHNAYVKIREWLKTVKSRNGSSDDCRGDRSRSPQQIHRSMERRSRDRSQERPARDRARDGRHLRRSRSRSAPDRRDRERDPTDRDRVRPRRRDREPDLADRERDLADHGGRKEIQDQPRDRDRPRDRYDHSGRKEIQDQPGDPYRFGDRYDRGGRKETRDRSRARDRFGDHSGDRVRFREQERDGHRYHDGAAYQQRDKSRF